MNCRVILILTQACLLANATSPLVGQTLEGTLLATFTNPTPATVDRFGGRFAAVGKDRLLIAAPDDDTGATDAGAAYLFTLEGTLLWTFTNPAPANFDSFGEAISSLGEDRIVMGVPEDDEGGSDSGVVYVFQTNGALLLTITNPTPTNAARFGSAVAELAGDRLLIGAPGARTGGLLGSGAAYLYDGNGTLLTTITNPTPALNDSFGRRVMAFGVGRILVGAYRDDIGANDAGAAYLFDTNGTLLTVFTNPTPYPMEYFGDAFAALGDSRILIGADAESTGAQSAGAAYLFDTNGWLLTTFTNPNPAALDRFGSSLATVASKWVLINDHRESVGATSAGVVRIYDMNATLLATVTNPYPSGGDYFGLPIAVLGSERLLVGALGKDAPTNLPATDVGAAYLLSVPFPYPSLDIERVDTTYQLSWLTDEPGLTLQQSHVLASPTQWADTPEQVTTNGLTNLVQQTVPAGVTNRFYRLRRP